MERSERLTHPYRLMLLLLTLISICDPALAEEAELNPDAYPTAMGYPDSVYFNVPVGDGPNGICVLPSGDYVYVTNDYSNNVSVIRTSDHTVIATIAVDSEPRGICASPDGELVFVGNFTGSSLSVIETVTNQVIYTIDVPYPWSSCHLPESSNLLYVTCYYADQVAVIDTNDSPPQILDMISVGQEPRGICCLPDENTLYVTNWADSTVSVIDTSIWPNEVITTVEVPYYPQAVAATPDGKHVWVGNFGFDMIADTISIIRTSDNTLAGFTLAGAGPECIAFLPGENYGYVSNRWENSVSIINTNIWPPQEVASVDVGAYPWNLCCHPDGDFVYVACVDSDVVSVIGHSSTGIEAQDNQGAPSFCVSPNPGYGAFELTLFILTSAGEMGFSKVEVFDVSGRLVFSEDLSWSQVGEHTFNISVSTPGLYLCRTSIAGTEFSASFVCLP